MSQYGQIAGGVVTIDTVTGNAGGAISPTLGNINIVGTGGISVTGNPATSTLTISASATGFVETLTGNTGGALAPVAGNINIVGSATSLITVAGAGNTLTINSTALTSGQLLIGSTGVAPVAATLTAGAGISIANGAGTITISLVGGANAIETITGNSGGAIGPTAGNINISGSATSIVSVAGAGSTLTLNSLAQTNGQLLIGSTGVIPVASTLTAGTGISITNGAGSITIAVNGAAVVETLTGNTGGALAPTAGNINIVGSGGIAVAGAGSTLTISASGAGFIENITGNTGGVVGPDGSNNINIVGTRGMTVTGVPASNLLNITNNNGTDNVFITAATGVTNVAMVANTTYYISRNPAAAGNFSTVNLTLPAPTGSAGDIIYVNTYFWGTDGGGVAPAVLIFPPAASFFYQLAVTRGPQFKNTTGIFNTYNPNAIGFRSGGGTFWTLFNAGSGLGILN